MEAGAVWGMRELADGHVFDDEDNWRVAERFARGKGAIVALVEHRWAMPSARPSAARVGTRWRVAGSRARPDRLGESSARIPLELDDA